MGKVYFLNEKAKKFHEENGIKVNQPQLKVVIDNGPKKPKRSKKKTLGQRIYDNKFNPNGDDIA